jgi:hypothetical protein
MFHKGPTIATFKHFLGASNEFSDAIISALKDANTRFTTYRIQCPTTVSTGNDAERKNFTIVVSNSPDLEHIRCNFRPFAKHLFYADRKGNPCKRSGAVFFPSLGGNMLVVPTLRLLRELRGERVLNWKLTSNYKDFRDIARFTANADKSQQRALWKLAARTLGKLLEKNDVRAARRKKLLSWRLCTEGNKVGHLHIRLETNRTSESSDSSDTSSEASSESSDSSDSSEWSTDSSDFSDTCTLSCCNPPVVVNKLR